jgi:hypothetical protein
VQSLARPWLGLTAIVVGASALLAVGTLQVREWVVQTDEMLYVKLARHMGTSGSPIPTLHGEHVGFLGVVYSIVLAPFYGGLDNVDAFTAAHAVNAVLFASAAVPVYLLGRRLVSPGWALAVALLAVSVPWAVNAAFVMSEAAAYPVFLWAVLACHVCIVEPSGARTRSRWSHWRSRSSRGRSSSSSPPFCRSQALITVGPRSAVRQHRMLAIAYGVGALLVIVLAALGQATGCSAITA